MTTVTVQQAQTALSELIARVTVGDEVVITQNDRPVARLVPTLDMPQRACRKLGTMSGTVLFMAPDFDAPLEDLREYSE